MVLVGVLSYQQTLHEDETQRWVSHTHLVLEAIAASRADLLNEQLNADEFAFTSDQSYLLLFDSAAKKLGDDLHICRTLTSDNPQQQQLLDRATDLIAAARTEQQRNIAVRQSQRLSRSVSTAELYAATESLTDLGAVLDKMESDERALLSKRLDGAAKSSIRTRFALLLGNSLALALLALAGVVIYREMARRHRAEAAIAGKNSELAAANHELQAFSYSVSHDLRAPLRSIDGFGMALLQDCEAQLDETGKDYLRRIRAATSRMSDLIDGMLTLSRLSRADMVRQQVNLSALANEIATELRASQPERHVLISVADGLSTTADRTLLRALLQNLLANAWKFTANRDSPTIELGSQRNGKEKSPVFYVRDNGAGFDMQYANKLFGVFQRLHRDSEFPGTGVGLATAQRIVHRHGGRIWAEAVPNQGATFYFTLG